MLIYWLGRYIGFLGLLLESAENCGIQARGNCSLTILEVRNKKSRCGQAHALPECSRGDIFLGFSWLLRVASNPWHSWLAASSWPVPSRGCLPSLSVSWSKVSSSYENSSCIRFRVPSNPVGPHFFIKIFFNVDNYFKSLLNLLQYFFCCLCPGFGCEAVGSSRPSQG